MPETLIKQIENHLATSPDRIKEVEEMKVEWKEFKERQDKQKNNMLYVVLGFAVSLISIGVWVGTMQTHIDSMLGHEDKDSERFIQIEARLNNAEVTNSEIRARLSSIDLTLQEIKVAIKNIN